MMTSQIPLQFEMEIRGILYEDRMCHILAHKTDFYALESVLRRQFPETFVERLGSCQSELKKPGDAFIVPGDRRVIVVADVFDMCLEYLRATLSQVDAESVVRRTTAFLVNFDPLATYGVDCRIGESTGDVQSRMTVDDFLGMYHRTVLVRY